MAWCRRGERRACGDVTGRLFTSGHLCTVAHRRGGWLAVIAAPSVPLVTEHVGGRAGFSHRASRRLPPLLRLRSSDSAPPTLLLPVGGVSHMGWMKAHGKTFFFLGTLTCRSMLWRIYFWLVLTSCGDHNRCLVSVIDTFAPAIYLHWKLRLVTNFYLFFYIKVKHYVHAVKCSSLLISKRWRRGNGRRPQNLPLIFTLKDLMSRSGVRLAGNNRP